MVKQPHLSKGIWYFRVRKVGNGLSISIPGAFAKAENLKAGMYIKITWDDHVLTVVPLKEA